MNLYREDILNWTSIQESGYPQFKFSETVPNGYVLYDSISDIYSIMNCSTCKTMLYDGKEYTNCDYKFIRNQIKIRYNTTGFANLNLDEKIIVSKLCIATVEERNMVLTTEQQVDLGQLFNQSATESRMLRASKAIQEMQQRLKRADALQIVTDVTDGKQLFNNYINFGLEGTLEEDYGSYLFDYILSRPGSDYETTGVRKYNFDIIGFNNMTDFSEYIIQILKTGIY